LRTNKITQQINTFRDARERKLYKCIFLEVAEGVTGITLFFKGAYFVASDNW